MLHSTLFVRTKNQQILLQRCSFCDNQQNFVLNWSYRLGDYVFVY